MGCGMRFVRGFLGPRGLVIRLIPLLRRLLWREPSRPNPLIKGIFDRINLPMTALRLAPELNSALSWFAIWLDDSPAAASSRNLSTTSGRQSTMRDPKKKGAQANPRP